MSGTNRKRTLSQTEKSTKKAKSEDLVLPLSVFQPTTPMHTSSSAQKTPSTASTVLDTPRTASTVLDTPYSNRSTISSVSTVLDPEWDIEDKYNDYTYAENGNILYKGKQVYTSDNWEPLTRFNKRFYTIIEPHTTIRKYIVSKKKGGKRRTTKRSQVKRQTRRTNRRTRH